MVVSYIVQQASAGRRRRLEISNYQDDSITPLKHHQSNEEVLNQRKEIRPVADNESLSQALSHEKVKEIAVISTDAENEAITAVDEAER